MLTVPFRRKDVKNENPHQIFLIPHQIFLITSMTFLSSGQTLQSATLSVAIRVSVCQLVVFVPGKDTLREANELRVAVRGKEQTHYRNTILWTLSLT